MNREEEFPAGEGSDHDKIKKEFYFHGTWNGVYAT